MFSSSYSNIYIESCIPFDTFSDSNLSPLNQQKIFQYINDYIFKKSLDNINNTPPSSSSPSIGYIILYLLSQNYANIEDLSKIYCGWKDVDNIKRIYDMFAKLNLK